MFEDVFINEPMKKGVKPYKGFSVMRKFFGAYVSGHPNASALKTALMNCNNANEVEQVLKILI